VFGDTQGNVVYLFERDGSVQRRHQKVIEEAPAPGMTAGRRRQMGEAAVAAARAVNYTGAGTVEFIAAPDGAFYFMEMNTRLQVEHPVTEMITGLDLVEWQLRVAAGEPLPLRQSELAIHGHAIEARIYAEDPAREFLPSIGKLVHVATPATSAGLRIDTGVRAGDEITPYYDPMIAKLIAHGGTRDEAIARLRAALAEYQVVGVHTNIEFLHRLTRTASFTGADLDTALIERERAQLLPSAVSPPAAIWATAAGALFPVVETQDSPWKVRNGWRLGSRAARAITLRSGQWEKVATLRFGDPGPDVEIDGIVVPAASGRVVAHGDVLHVFFEGAHWQFKVVDPYLPPEQAAEAHGGLTAPMPGRVLAVLVKPGELVARGMPLLIMEAMKMEHTITAPADGTVDKLLCSVGEQVKEGAELLVFSGRKK
jgi:3-methylcrotonyl-CoA carboxylase alpha subunit